MRESQEINASIAYSPVEKRRITRQVNKKWPRVRKAISEAGMAPSSYSASMQREDGQNSKIHLETTRLSIHLDQLALSGGKGDFIGELATMYLGQERRVLVQGNDLLNQLAKGMPVLSIQTCNIHWLILGGFQAGKVLIFQLQKSIPIRLSDCFM
jgi:hypothetical protein